MPRASGPRRRPKWSDLVGPAGNGNNDPGARRRNLPPVWKRVRMLRYAMRAGGPPRKRVSVTYIQLSCGRTDGPIRLPGRCASGRHRDGMVLDSNPHVGPSLTLRPSSSRASGQFRHPLGARRWSMMAERRRAATARGLTPAILSEDSRKPFPSYSGR